MTSDFLKISRPKLGKMSFLFGLTTTSIHGTLGVRNLNSAMIYTIFDIWSTFTLQRLCFGRKSPKYVPENWPNYDSKRIRCWARSIDHLRRIIDTEISLNYLIVQCTWGSSCFKQFLDSVLALHLQYWQHATSFSRHQQMFGLLHFRQ